jgi:hypothetical protein
VDDDAALLELGTRQAAHLGATLGPYSRFEWSHPGPLAFYLLAPLYELCGERTGALFLGALLLNLAAAAGVVLVARRLGGPRHAALAAGAAALLFAALGPRTSASIWNPHLTVLPLLLHCFLCAGLALEGAAYLPALAFTTSFLVQTHVGYAPVALALLLTGAALRLAWRGGAAARLGEDDRHGARRPAWKPALCALGIALLVWLPPLAEEVEHRPGNLSRLVRFFAAKRSESHPLREVFAAFASRLTLGTLPGAAAPIAAGLLVLLVGLAAAVALRRRSRYASATALLALVACGSALFSLAQVEGPIHDYLTVWIAAAGVLLLAAVAGAALERVRRGELVLAAVGAVALLGAVRNTRLLGAEPPMPIAPLPAIEALSREAAAYLALHAGPPPLVRLRTREKWVEAAGLLLELQKRRVAFSVEERWQFLFGRALTGKDGDVRALLIGGGELHEETEARPDGVLVSARFGTVVWVLEDPLWVSRHLLRRKSEVVEARGASGDPALASDGVFPEDGSWSDSPGCLVLKGPDASVTVAAPEDVAGLVVSADQNDAYAVLVSADGASYEEIGLLRPVLGRGMQRRVFFSPRLKGARRVRIAPREGDGVYAIGEVGFILGSASR